MPKKEPLRSTQAIFDRALLLAKRGNEDFLELGRLLRQLHESDKTLFKLAYKQAEIGRRTAYSFLQIAQAFDGMPVEDEQLAAIGSTRALILAPYVTTDNCQSLVAQAVQHSTRDLRIIMAGGRPMPGTRAVLLYLKPNQYAQFTKAIEAHGGTSIGGALGNKERALMNILDAIGGASQ